MPLTRPAGLALLLSTAVSGCGPAPGEARTSSDENRVTLADAPDRYFITNGVKIRYREIGAGDPVLLIHGYTDRVEMWSGTADSLARDFRVIVPDTRGFGLSTKFADRADYGRRMVGDMIALLDHLKIPRAHVMGYSMGALIGSHLALDYRERIPTVTFVAGAFYPDSLSAARVWEPYARSIARGEGLAAFFRYILPTWPDSAIDAAAKHYFVTNDSASLVASLEGLADLIPDPARVPTARTPAVAIVGRADGIAELSVDIARRWPNTRLVVLPDGDHGDIFLLPEVIEEFRALVRRSAM